MYRRQYTEEEQAQRYAQSLSPLWPPVAQVVSGLFHPLFLLFYAFLILAWSNPYLFGVNSFGQFFESRNNHLIALQILSMSALMPLFGMVLMRSLNLVSSLSLANRQERIGPYLVTGLFYMILFFNVNGSQVLPFELKVFSLGATIAIFVCFVVNLFSKISMHSTGMGGFLAMILLILARTNAYNEYLLVLTVLACGLVGSARLLLRAHEPSDIYGGYAVGFLAQFVALSVLFEPDDFMEFD